MVKLKIAGVTFNITTATELENAWIKADKIKLEQVLRNFITNAVKFTPKTGTISVIASLIQVPSLQSPSKKENPSLPSLKVRVEVIDTGEGISVVCFKSYIHL